jgi:ABC-2 type transport system permease protein
MRNTTTIALREFKSYLASPTAYVVTGIFLLLAGFLFSISPTTYNETSLRGLWGLWGVMGLLLIAAVLTMRLLAEEKKMGTLELLLTAPVRDSEVIAGKFLGSLGILTVMLALTFYYPILLMWFGDPDWGPIVTSYLGLFLLGGASLAVGLFASSLTSNQIVAAVVAGGILFALWFAGMAADLIPEALGEVISSLSFSSHFSSFMRGVIDTRGIIYYLSITALFLFLAIRSFESSRWS